MNNNIQIINKNGDVMSVEGIAHLKILTKNYLIYTLNEKVENDLTKIYVAETSPTQGIVGPISDEEWALVRDKLRHISDKEELPDVTYLPIAGVTFNVAEAKKLAVTSVAKQSFIDSQVTHTLATSTEETPVVGGGAFFAQPENVQQQAPASDSQNIFDNPIAPENNVGIPPVGETVPQIPEAITQVPQNVDVQNYNPSQNNLSNGEVINTINEGQQIPPNVNIVNEGGPIPSNAGNVSTITNTVINSAPIQQITDVEAIEPVIEPVAAPAIAEANIDTPAIEVNPAQQPVPGDNLQNDIKGPVISDEEALKAIGVIQEYIAQEEAE